MGKDKVKVAVGQFDVKLFDKKRNISAMRKMAIAAKEKHGADIIVFPECSITGYCYATKKEAFEMAEYAEGESVLKIYETVKEVGICIVFGMIEKQENVIYNSSVFLAPNGLMEVYRKTHLPFLGVDKFTQPGDNIHAFDSSFGKIGMIICYDLRFPEPARVLGLNGARLILEPTNLPVGAEALVDIFSRARACENRLYIVSANRTGVERGTTFIGRSQIVDTNGNVICEMSREEGIISAELDLTAAEQKHSIIIPKEYEYDIFKDRRPELYDFIVKYDI